MSQDAANPGTSPGRLIRQSRSPILRTSVSPVYVNPQDPRICDPCNPPIQIINQRCDPCAPVPQNFDCETVVQEKIVEKPIYREKIVYVERIIHKPVKNIVKIPVPRKRVQWVPKPVCTDVAQCQPVIFVDEKPQERPLEVCVPCPQPNVITVRNQEPCYKEIIHPVTKTIQVPCYKAEIVQVEQITDQICEQEQVCQVEVVQTNVHETECRQDVFQEEHEEQRSQTCCPVYVDVPRPVAGEICVKPYTKTVEVPIPGPCQPVQMSTEIACQNSECVQAVENVEVPQYQEKCNEVQRIIEVPQRQVQYCKQQQLEVQTVCEPVNKIVQRPLETCEYMEVDCKIQCPKPVKCYENVTKIIEQPVYEEKIITIQRTNQLIKEKVTFLKSNGNSMTGAEFVNTWNDLFRLRDNDQCPDKCLEKVDFIETISDNIGKNASKLLQGQNVPPQGPPAQGMIQAQTPQVQQMYVQQIPAQVQYVQQPAQQYVRPGSQANSAYVQYPAGQPQVIQGQPGQYYQTQYQPTTPVSNAAGLNTSQVSNNRGKD